jgi:CRP/FNR family transcriptional regulator, cyclic AMP receptor protein
LIPAALFEPLILAHSPRRFNKGVLLIQEGETDDRIYILVEGKMRAFAQSADDKEVTYGLYGPIDIFGELALDGGPRSASMIAAEDCKCSVLTCAQLESYMAANPLFTSALLKRVIERTRQVTHAAKSLALLDVYGRLRDFLLRHSTEDALGYRTVEEKLTQQDIAYRIGSSREMVARLLKDLEKGGYLTHEKKIIVVKGQLPAQW